ncbi:hypothetical protein AN958_03679 [Leucoagaricus sp. SymC.cos]|nr:hypothetical protein AN958_03679 [Leucoagaricus sp. SymC.cos]
MPVHPPDYTPRSTTKNKELVVLMRRLLGYLHHVIWANCITIRKGTECSPYCIITSTHPTLSLNIQKATWLVNYPRKMMSTEDFIGLRATALAKHIEHVEAMYLRANKEKLA